MKRIFLILFIFSAISCNYFQIQSAQIIRIKGSDTMLKLAQNWAGTYMEKNPNVSIYIESGGSATGFSALAEGKADIALASRVINSQEVRRLGEKYKQLGLSFLAAKDALSIYLNPENPISDLSIAQLNGIFNGTIINWKELGGLDEPVLVALRPPSSGTYYFFKSRILQNAPYVDQATTLPTTTQIISYVQSNRNAIGYGGIAYGREVKHARIAGIEANEENVRKSHYPLARYLYLYTIEKPKGEVKRFIDWILASRGQHIVRQVGYIPLWE